MRTECVLGLGKIQGGLGAGIGISLVIDHGCNLGGSQHARPEVAIPTTEECAGRFAASGCPCIVRALCQLAQKTTTTKTKKQNDKNTKIIKL